MAVGSAARGRQKAGADADRPRHWSPHLYLGVIVAFAIGLPLLVAAGTGALHIPRNDDWSYSRTALELSEFGRLRLRGWGVMTLVGHVAWAQPWLSVLGRSQQSLHVAQATAATLGVLVAYQLLRQFLPTQRSLLVVATVAVMPGYGLLATGFMTDTTFFAAQVASLAIGLHGLGQRRRYLWLAGGVAIGFMAFTVREVGLAAPAAVLVAHLYAAGRRRDWSFAAATVAIGSGLLVSAGLLLVWRRGLPGSQSLPSAFDFQHVLVTATRAYFTLALSISPILLLLGTHRWRRGLLDRRSRRIVVPLAVVLLIVASYMARGLLQQTSQGLLSGNVLTRLGSMDSSVLLGTRPPVFPHSLWYGLTALAVTAGVALLPVIASTALRVAATLRSRSPLDGKVVGLMAFTLLSIGLIIVHAAIGAYTYDRYLWGLALVTMLWLAREAPVVATRRVLPLLALLILFAISAVVTVDELTYDAARWRAGVVASNLLELEANEIDAGFEWVGYHYEGVAGPFSESQWKNPQSPYAWLYPLSTNCAIVATSPLSEPGLEIIQQMHYQRYLLVGHATMYIHHNGNCGAG